MQLPQISIPKIGLDAVDFQNPNAPVCVIGVEGEVEIADPHEVDDVPTAQPSPGVAGLSRVFGKHLEREDQPVESRVLTRAQRHDGGFVQRVTVARHLRRLRMPRRLELIFRNTAACFRAFNPNGEFFEKFRIVEPMQMFEVARHSRALFARELGQGVDNRVEVHAATMRLCAVKTTPF